MPRFLELFLFPRKNLAATRLCAALEYKTVLITGASYGIGEALSLICAFPKTNLILVARTTEKLLEAKKRIEQKGGNGTVITADLRDEKQVKSLISHLKERSQSVDIFINNAGKSIRRSIWKSLDRFHDVKRTTALNYHAPVQICLALIPDLAEKQGQIINVSALNILLPPAPKWAAYQASKTAFDQWLHAAAPELKANGISCSTAYLPLVRTRMIEPTKAYDKAPAMSPEQAAIVLARLIISRKRVYKPWWTVFLKTGSFFFGGLLRRYFNYQARNDT
jgi:short-subunit dehydrogenase